MMKLTHLDKPSDPTKKSLLRQSLNTGRVTTRPAVDETTYQIDGMRCLKLVPSRQSPTGDLGSQFWSCWWLSGRWHRASWLVQVVVAGQARRASSFDVLSKPLIGAWICGRGMVSGLLESTARHNELTEWC